jgi:aryl-phospho-beta-D-glucosidase BglC (GH1 family)
MSPNRFRDEDLRVLGEEWNANVIRWQLMRNWGVAGTDRDLAEYDRWLHGRLDEFEAALDACLRYGILAVLDMHSPPGGRYPNNDLAIFHEPLYQDHFVALWEQMARRFHGHPALWAYDLINEPVQNDPPPPGVADFLGAQTRAARAIRAIDPDTPIFIAAAAWDSPDGFRDLVPVDVPNVIYQVHLYTPHPYTHQGVNSPWTPISYPGAIDGTHWDKDQLRQTLEPVRAFQLAYNTHIYAGEFSAIRWAPGANAYLHDCIELFEEYNWDWTYHAYREWDGWSVEHTNNPDNHQPAPTPTDRMQILLECFAKNRKPPTP